MKNRFFPVWFYFSPLYVGISSVSAAFGVVSLTALGVRQELFHSLHIQLQALLPPPAVAFIINRTQLLHFEVSQRGAMCTD